MTELFVRLSRYFSSHRTVCWLSMVALFAFFGYFAAQIHLEEDINKSPVWSPSTAQKNLGPPTQFWGVNVIQKSLVLRHRQ